MRTLLKIVVGLVFICGCSASFPEDSPTPPKDGAEPGTVTITYVLHKIKTKASNQIAVWIEDEEGNYVKSLYATRFGADGGFKKRPDTLPEWVQASDWANASATEVDAVSGATQSAGTKTLVWDLTDRTGKPVPFGTYIYKIEGNIFWANRVLWQGRIDVGIEADRSTAAAVYFPSEAVEKGVLMEQVGAVYEPAE